MNATPGAATAPDFAIEPLGEDALLLRVEGQTTADANRRVHALAAEIATRRPAWLRELVPAYASLALQVDMEALQRCGHGDPVVAIRSWLDAQRFDAAPGTDADSGPALEIAVCYGGDHGPDLDAVAAHADMHPDDVVNRHAAAVYTVAMLGFAPGFPYLSGLDPALATPRLDTPRTRVPAGSVGIGGAQTGIYPRQGPGGWRLIARTPLALFDAARSPPSLLRPGQQVRFVAIDASGFDRLAASARRRRPA